MSSERSEPAEGPGGDETPPSEPPGGTTKGLGDLAEEQSKTPPQLSATSAEKTAAEGKAKEEPPASSLPPKEASDEDSEPQPPSQARRVEMQTEKPRPQPRKAPLQKMRPCLDGLTEELTLGIFQELDFRSLAAVKRVCRRLSRIAQDPSLLGRVSRAQWTVGTSVDDQYGWPFDHGPESLFRTDCPQLGPLAMPADGEAGRAKFLGVLEWLLEGGASLVSLQTPMVGDGDVVAALPALLTRHKVRLEALSCCSKRPAFPELLRSQPGLTQLFLSEDNKDEDLRPLLPSVRHVAVVGDVPYWLEKLVPQLRSVVVHMITSITSLKFLGAFAPLDGGLVRKGQEPLPDGLKFVALDLVGDGPGKASHVALAVEDFSVEERGAPFLKDGRPADLWDLAKHRLPQPTHCIYDVIRVSQEVNKQALFNQ